MAIYGFGTVDDLVHEEAVNKLDPLASSEERVPNCFMDHNQVLERNGGIHGSVDGLGLLDHVGLEIETALHRFCLLLLIDSLLPGEDLLRPDSVDVV
ncbi:hypothetical protein M0R45_031157 [Rubus argutus]|uniref:Uncharacterized protein n=1 Tax=Rubus argutus TaxID=59490 RepID=A0AAW1WFC3_RUBAR